ncbi:ATP-binding protein [Billgrantia endophytica]|uniref:ATP-binding protein n=1 Tax=Billgrantia endophytica TaxID=2033802 RepID=A0A2N7TXJ7_9GAMM|nr:ATP-binding protein [Halomonas endophytica]
MRPTTPLIVAGSEVEFIGRDFTPGQEITLSRGDTVLNPEPYVADAEGGLSGTFTLPEDAVPGRHPIVLRASNPSAARIVELKISPQVPLSGEDRFDVAEAPLPQGLYQTAYSAGSDALFVTSAVGRPPVTESALLKVDPHTLEVLAQATPEQVPGYDDQRVFATYGVGVDDANDNVWITNTREDTISVYRQSDLSLVKQFDIGTVPHSRDVIVDTQRGKAYVSATGENYISVFDATSLDFITNIEIASALRGERFVPMSLELDEESGRLFTVSLNTPEAVVIDTENDSVEKVVRLANANRASGVAYDAESERLLVASQGSDNLLYVDLASGEIVHDVPVGAGPLNVAFDTATGLAYVSNRASGTVTVLDREGQIVANLDGGTFPNHVHEDGKGNVFAVNKSRGEDDPQGDHIRRIAPSALQ